MLFWSVLFLVGIGYAHNVIGVEYSRNLGKAIGERNVVRTVKRKGILLFSEGRSATTSISNTLVNSNITSLSFCNGHKESFILNPPTRKRLDRCFHGRNNDIVYAHVKPIHIKNYEKAIEVIKFINNAHAAGFGFIIVNKRQNALARAISSAELKYESLVRESSRAANKQKELFLQMESRFSKPSNLISFIETNYVAIELGRMRAQVLGMALLEFDFVDLIQNLCSVSEKITFLMSEIGYIRKADLNNVKCTEVKAKSFKSNQHRTKTLAERVGTKSARILTDFFSETPYSWMLNLSATEWPETKRNPCYSIRNCLDSEMLGEVEAFIRLDQ